MLFRSLGQTLSSPRWHNGHWQALCGVGGQRRPCQDLQDEAWLQGVPWLDEWHDTPAGPVAVTLAGDRRWAATPDGPCRTRTGG